MLFELHNVTYRDILNIEHLEIENNTITCVVGESGGGKTTFLQLLNNMISPDSGEILFKGKNIKNYDPVQLRRQIPMLPQNPILFSGTIYDNFQQTQKYAGLNQEQKNYDSILKKVKLSDFSPEDSVQNLSGGEKQRLALARILLLEPSIMLLDEPSAALDENTEEQIVQMVIEYIKKSNSSLVMVTHSLEIAHKYGDCLIHIDGGSITETTNIKED